ncbi:MAG: S9 family peptidase, partial [Bacteroidota bacterium]
MRHFIMLGLCSTFLCLAACTSGSGETTEAVPVKQYSIEQFMDNETVFGASFSPDGQHLLVTSDRSGIRNAYQMPVAGGEPEALTNSDSSSVYGVSYFPNDGRVILQMDNNGDEVWQLYIREEDGTVNALTDVPEARATFSGWAQDGESFYISWSKRDQRFMDLYEVPVTTLETQL